MKKWQKHLASSSRKVSRTERHCAMQISLEKLTTKVVVSGWLTAYSQTRMQPPSQPKHKTYPRESTPEMEIEDSSENECMNREFLPKCVKSAIV